MYLGEPKIVQTVEFSVIAKDDYRDAGGRATHGAIDEVRLRQSIRFCDSFMRLPRRGAPRNDVPLCQDNYKRLYLSSDNLYLGIGLKQPIMMVMKHILLILMVFMTLSCGHSVSSKNSAEILNQLYQRQVQWQGTPYQLGGMSQQGIDCSGFVQLTFAEEFGVPLPRTTEAQAQLSGAVKKDELQTGDLVFFKIPNQVKLYHVGIYLEEGQFLHASTSQGVIVSDLASDYWHNNYWRSIRVLD